MIITVIRLNDFDWEQHLDLFDQATIAYIRKSPLQHKQREKFASALLKKYYLAYILQLSLEEVEVEYNQYNKPVAYIKKSNSTRQPLYFNISHSADYVVIAIDTAYEMGIDIQKIRDSSLIHKSRLIFSASEQKLVQQHTEYEARRQAFFMIWTKKESYLKAIGCGIGNSKQLQDSYIDNSSYQLINNYEIAIKKFAESYYIALCRKLG